MHKSRVGRQVLLSLQPPQPSRATFTNDSPHASSFIKTLLLTYYTTIVVYIVSLFFSPSTMPSQSRTSANASTRAQTRAERVPQSTHDAEEVEHAAAADEKPKLITDLAPETLIDIFSRLPAQQLGRLRQVSFHARRCWPLALAHLCPHP